MGFFWANVKANIEGAVANAKMHYYEEKLRSIKLRVIMRFCRKL